jgi:hypothetical protein
MHYCVAAVRLSWKCRSHAHIVFAVGHFRRMDCSCWLCVLSTLVRFLSGCAGWEWLR